MMEFGYNPGVLDNQRFYNQHLEDSYYQYRDFQLPEEDIDDRREEIQETTSEERSSSADLFRLKFAATQWSKLVSNAEGLFTKLVASNILPHNEQDQIEQWLCLKQEYEECISNDDSSSLPGFPETNRRSLERIEEVTETDEKTDDSANPEFLTESRSESEMCEDDDEDDEEEEQSDENSNNPDFLDKLDEFMNRFKLETDRLIESVDSSYDDQLPIILSGKLPLNINEPIVKPIPIRKQNSRRNSMMPGSDMCNEVLMFNGLKKSVEKFHRSFKDNSPDILVDTLRNDESVRKISTDDEEKSMKTELNVANDKIEELELTIKEKEQLISNMIKNQELLMNSSNNSMSGLVKKINRKRIKLKKDKSRELELCKNLSIHYEKKHLVDIEKIKKIADDSAKKVLELELSLNKSKFQMELLKTQLKAEVSVDNEIKADEDGKLLLRKQIENLRHTKDKLVEQKCDLDEKLQKEKTLTTDEERKRLECGETIEMIDAMIEHKNEMICGRKSSEKPDESEKMMIDKHLSKLSEPEMKQLFYAYFRKVIDLKESSRSLEVQMAGQDALVESQESNIRMLTSVLKQMKIEAERRNVIQKQYEEKLQLMFRHITNESGSSSHEKLDKDSEFSKIKRENRMLKRRLADFEALFRGSEVPTVETPQRVNQRIASHPEKTTKVTRQRNKLIIQKTD